MKKLLVSLFTLLVVIFLMGCSNDGGKTEGVVKAPSGNDCAENVAYLQDGVNKYKVANGELPADVNTLLEKKDGKGPFVEKVPACPGGNLYKVDANGIVFEAPSN